MFDGLQKFIAIKAARWAATLAAGAIVGWLADHAIVQTWINQACTTLSDPEKLSAGIVSLAVAGATLFFSGKDVMTTNAKIVTAAATASVAAVNDPAVRAAAAEAIKAGEIPAPDGIRPDISQIIADRMTAARG